MQMRAIFSALIGLSTLVGATVVDSQPSQAQYAAQYYPYCARYYGRGGGSTSCYFRSLAQCRASVSGVGGFCDSNPWYAAAVAPAYRYKYRRRY